MIGLPSRRREGMLAVESVTTAMRVMVPARYMRWAALRNALLGGAILDMQYAGRLWLLLLPPAPMAQPGERR